MNSPNYFLQANDITSLFFPKTLRPYFSLTIRIPVSVLSKILFFLWFSQTFPKPRVKTYLLPYKRPHFIAIHRALTLKNLKNLNIRKFHILSQNTTVTQRRTLPLPPFRCTAQQEASLVACILATHSICSRGPLNNY